MSEMVCKWFGRVVCRIFGCKLVYVKGPMFDHCLRCGAETWAEVCRILKRHAARTEEER